MTKQEIIDFALTLDNASADSPFEEDFESVVLRHSDTKKWFGLIMLHNDEYILNLKCEPQHSDFLKNQYNGIREAYHMNKRLWITVSIQSDVPEDEIKNLIMQSYSLTSKHRKK